MNALRAEIQPEGDHPVSPMTVGSSEQLCRALMAELGPGAPADATDWAGDALAQIVLSLGYRPHGSLANLRQAVTAEYLSAL